MINLSYSESTAQSEQSNQTGDTNMDANIMSQSRDDSIHNRHPQSAFEEPPDLVTHPSNIRPSVIFDSDTEDSDDDGDQDRTPYLQQEMPPSPRSTMDTGTEQTSHTGKFVSAI